MSIDSFFRSYFVKKEVKEVLAALKAIEVELAARKDVGEASPFMGLDMVRSEAKRLVVKNDGYVLKKLKEGGSPRKVAVTLLMNQVDRVLRSGAHHASKGVLESPRGESLLLFWDYLCDELVSLGFATGEEAEHARASMRETVREAGG